MDVDVYEEANVVCTPGCNKVYQPGLHRTVPRAHIAQIEAQGKGARVDRRAEDAQNERSQDERAAVGA